MIITEQLSDGTWKATNDQPHMEVIGDTEAIVHDIVVRNLIWYKDRQAAKAARPLDDDDAMIIPVEPYLAAASEEELEAILQFLEDDDAEKILFPSSNKES